MRKKHRSRQICSVLMILMIIFTSLPLGVMEAEAATPPVKIKVTYGQTEARAMLADINAFRTSEKDAWCWDMRDSTKQPCSTTELEYDYELERVAMQRAAEIALSYDHTRPNGKACFTAYPSGYRGMGENIAAGYASAAEVFDGWKEENESYAGQGHRRNMLSAKFKAVGIGHVVYQGCHYWVQEFGDRVKNGAASGANDDTQIVDVDVASSYITAVKTNLDDVSLKVGEKATAADFSLALNVVNQWGYQKDCVIENECSAKIEDETIASLSDDAVITGLKSGTTKIWISNPFGSDFYRTITVTKGTEDKGKISVEAIADQTYTGSALTPKVVVKAGSKVLTQNVDYTVLYSNNVNVGTASVKITGKGSYKGSYTENFKIVACSIAQATCSRIADQTYSGKAIEPTFTVTYKNRTLRKGTDYTVSFKDNVNIGTATVKITGKGNFEGTKEITFKITEPSEITVESIADQTYTGSALTPKVIVKAGSKVLTKNVDYTVSYSNNVNVGTASVKITGKGSYKGSYTENFKIVACSIAQATCSRIADQTYSGKAIEPTFTVTYKNRTLRKGTDYTVSFKDNVNIGTATVKITGKGNFEGTKEITFKITEPSEITVESIADQTYTGSALTPKVIVKAGSKVLTKNVDYTVSYSNNVNVGTASVKITGKGSYKGSYTVNFKILPCAISKAGIRKIIDQRYNGNEIKPSVSLTYKYKTLKKGTDYTVSYSNNINAGTATVTITGIGSYEGTASTTFQIKPRSLREITARKISTQEYTGQEITPKLNLTYKGKTLTENVDYVAVYSNNIEPGNGVVNIQGKGNFTEQRKLVFSIQRKNKPVEKEDEEEDDDDQEEIIHTKTMKLSKTQIALKKGKTYRLKVKVNAGSTDSISFKSSNKKIATVSKKGVIKAKKAGKVRITVKSGNITRRCVVVVKSGK